MVEEENKEEVEEEEKEDAGEEDKKGEGGETIDDLESAEDEPALLD